MNKDLFTFYTIGVFSVLCVTVFAYYIFLNKKHRWRRFYFLLMVVLIISSSYMVFAQYFKYCSLHFFVDFSCFSQTLNNIVTTGKPLSYNHEFLIPGTLNFFSAHFVPGLYFLALPFKLWPHSETLIIINFLLMVFSIIPLYLLTRTLNKNKAFGLFMMTLLLWYPTFQYTVLYEFDMLRFSIPIFFWMLYFWEKRRMNLYFIFVFFAILTREEVGLTIMMFGLYLLFIEKKRKVGLITSLLGLGGAVIITQIIMPALRNSDNCAHISAAWFADFGSSPLEIIKNLFLHPKLTISTVFQVTKVANIFMFFLPLLFIPFFAPSILISISSTFGMGMISASQTQLSYMLYYMSPSIPFIFYAFIKGWPRFLTTVKKLTGRWFKGRDPDINSAAMTAVLSGLLVANIFFGPSPVSLQFWFKNIRPAPFNTQDFHNSVYKISKHHRKINEFCEIIPDSAIVSAQLFLFPRLIKKKGTMTFPRFESSDGKFKAEYVLFDKTNNGLSKKSSAYMNQSIFDIVEKDKKTWELVKSKDGYFLYKRINE